MVTVHTYVVYYNINTRSQTKSFSMGIRPKTLRLYGPMKTVQVPTHRSVTEK